MIWKRLLTQCATVATSWNGLLILLTIEVMVRLQVRGTIRGPTVLAIKTSKVLLYCTLWIIAAWWLSLGHVRFAWDEALWILAFVTIEGNMRYWKKEIELGQPVPQASGGGVARARSGAQKGLS